MSFASLDTDQATNLIARFAEADQTTLIVGAGASMEASLPSWQELVERLLLSVAKEEPTLTRKQSERDWVKRTIESEGLLGAAAIVEAIVSDALDRMLPKELYDSAGPSTVEPGPIASQVAYLRRSFGDRLALLTTNYDDLIERALLASGFLPSQVKSYVSRHKSPRGVVPVTHLHGYAGRAGPPRKLVLTEGHYHRMQKKPSWQEECVTERLQRSMCLFIGTSLNDPNLVRYLYGYKQSSSRRHAAVFVREGSIDGASGEVRAARERAVAKRWRRCGVECLFVDHYGDAAQLLFEIAHRRADCDLYEPVATRARRALTQLEHIVVSPRVKQAVFAETQVELSRWLRATLEDALRIALDGQLPAKERLALTLWLLSPDGRRITAWAHSDRAHQDPATIESIPVLAESRWIAVKAICKGVRVDRDPHDEFSRWRFVRALPLIIDRPTRLPIGCLTIATTCSAQRSVLTTMAQEGKRLLHSGLISAVAGPLVDLLEVMESRRPTVTAGR